MDKLQAMRTFLEVARGQSFAAAGRALNASPATITRTIAALEESIGADLFIRNTRTVVVNHRNLRRLHIDRFEFGGELLRSIPHQ